MTKLATLGITLMLMVHVASASEPEVSRERVVLRTTAGDLVLVLYRGAAPQHVGQFLQLVRLGAYDTVEIFRVIPGFVVQLAEVDSRRLPINAAQAAAIHNLPLELSGLLHRRGMLSMARRENDTMSARTSFSILLGDAPHLNGKYTIFGYVESGYDVLEEIAKVPTDENDRPLQRIEVLKAEVVPSVEALENTYVAGARPIGGAAERPRAPRTFYLGAVGVMSALALAGFALGDRVSRRVHAAINLLICFVGGFVLFTYLAPAIPGGHVQTLAILVGVLAVLKLMGKFESPF